VRWRDEDGRERGESFDRKGRADDYAAEIRGKLVAGTYIDPRAGAVKLTAYATAWLEAQTTDPNTRQAMELRFRLHILAVLGGRELWVLAARPSLVQAWSRGLQTKGLAPNYCRTLFTNLSAVLTAAVDDGLIPRNPCRVGSVRPPAPDRRRVQPWLVERVRAVRAALPERYAATVDCGAGVGERQGEVFGLAVDDVDWLRRIVHVVRQVKIIDNQLVFAPPKGGKERDVPLAEAVALRLAAHLESWPATTVTLPWREPGGKLVSARLIFTSREHKAINRNYFNSHLWKPALVAAGVIPKPAPGEKYVESREHGFHALRHHFASVLLAEGVDIRTLAEYLGHEDPGFTLRVYTHLMPNSEEKARRAIDRALGAVDGSRGPDAAGVVSEVHNPRSERYGLRRRSTGRTRGGSGAGGSGRSRCCACSRSRFRSGPG
jgi:integrase